LSNPLNICRSIGQPPGDFDTTHVAEPDLE
jgi:hypothetical protein